MVPLRLLRPLTTAGLTLALVSCQTNISQGMKVYPLSRTQPHDGLAVVNQPDGYGVHIWLDTDTRQAGVCQPLWNADPARLFNGNGSAPFSSGLASREEFFEVVRNGEVARQLRHETEALCKTRAPKASFQWREPPKQADQVVIEELPALGARDLWPDPSQLRSDEQQMQPLAAALQAARAIAVEHPSQLIGDLAARGLQHHIAELLPHIAKCAGPVAAGVARCCRGSGHDRPAVAPIIS